MRLGILILVAASVVALIGAGMKPAEASRASAYRCSAEGIPDTYDAFFKAAARRHFPLELKDEWCILKAICWNESALNPDAVSHAGAEGLCQVMPATAADLKKRNKWRGNIRKAKDNAEASALTFALFWRFWILDRTRECRTEVTVASYNAGPGSIEDAHQLSAGERCWEGIRPYLHLVTGAENSRETINYVSRFWSTWRRLKGYGL